MKIFLIILVFFPLMLKAQQDTIKIPVHVAKLIVKDLTTGDSAKAELVLATEQISLLEQKVGLKDSIISNHVQKGMLYETRIKNELLKFDTQVLWVKDLEKKNKALKVKLTFTKLVAGIIVGALGYLYIIK